MNFDLLGAATFQVPRQAILASIKRFYIAVYLMGFVLALGAIGLSLHNALAAPDGPEQFQTVKLIAIVLGMVLVTDGVAFPWLYLRGAKLTPQTIAVEKDALLVDARRFPWESVEQITMTAPELAYASRAMTIATKSGQHVFRLGGTPGAKAKPSPRVFADYGRLCDAVKAAIPFSDRLIMK